MPDAKVHVTINDIAAMSGVSKTTVSRYLNGKYELMGADTRKRIEAAIKFSGYQPSAAARSLKTQRSHLVGIIVSEITSPFSSAIIKGAGEEFEKNGYVPVFVDSDRSVEREESSCRSLLSHQVEGFLVNPASNNNPNLIALANAGTPVVLCDRDVYDFNFDIATSDYVAPVVELLQHLKDQGFGRVGLFMQKYQENSVRIERIKAFYNHYNDYFEGDPEELVYIVDASNIGEVTAKVSEFLDSTPEGITPALIGHNTVTLTSVISALLSLGVMIPDEVGVCGSDDWDWSSSIACDWPELVCCGITTYKTQPTQIGAAAARLLINRIENPDSPKERVLVPTKLIIRNSTLLKRES